MSDNPHRLTDKRTMAIHLRIDRKTYNFLVKQAETFKCSLSEYCRKVFTIYRLGQSREVERNENKADDKYCGL